MRKFLSVLIVFMMVFSMHVNVSANSDYDVIVNDPNADANQDLAEDLVTQQDQSTLDESKVPSAREVYSGYNRSGNYILRVNNNQIRNAYTRDGPIYVTSNERINPTWSNVNERVEVVNIGNELFSTKSVQTIYSQPFTAGGYFSTGKKLPVGSYKATKQVKNMVYITSDYGNGWISISNGNFAWGTTSIGGVNGVATYVKMIPASNTYTRPGNKMNPTFVTIHNTGSTGSGANARAHANLQYAGNSRQASWHFTVDNTQIWQSIPMNEVAYHAGDGSMQGNMNTIAIEICENSDGNYRQAEVNAAKLTAKILWMNNLPSNAVRMHRDWSGKTCPANMIKGTKNSMGWTNFCNLVASEYRKLGATPNHTSATQNHTGDSTGKASNAPTLKYSANNCITGWGGTVTEPNTAGSTGRSLDLYQLKLNLSNVNKSAYISGKVYERDKGWVEYENTNGVTVGTDGRPMTKINFAAYNINGYKLQYRVHSANVGWMNWVDAGNDAGSGNNTIQAVDFRLVADSSVEDNTPHIYYTSHTANVGWSGNRTAGQTAGSTSGSNDLQAFTIGFDNLTGVNLNAKVYDKTNGWTTYNNVTGSTTIGTTGKSLSLKAFKLSATGNVGENVYQYRAYIQGSGWTEWQNMLDASSQVGSESGNNILAIQANIIPIIHMTGVAFEKSSYDVEHTSSVATKLIYQPTNTTDSRAASYTSSNTAIATVSDKGIVTGIKEGQTTITAKVGSFTTSTTINVIKQTPVVNYTAHVSSVGWQGYKTSGYAGTTGQSKSVEAIKMKLSNTADYSGSISYQAYCQNKGWVTVGGDDGVSGTTGQSLRMEAMRVQLSGDIASAYDVYYRTHIQSFGWTDWAKDNEISGSMGYGYRLEAYEVKLVKKAGSLPGATTTKYHETLVAYSGHQQNVGNLAKVYDGSSLGQTGKSQRLEAIRLTLPKVYADKNLSGSIRYRVHVQNTGWQSYKTDGALAGTTGKGLRLEAIQIELTGEMAQKYDVEYRTHIQNKGWENTWHKNGDVSGTTGKGLRLEAIQVRLVKK
ncbi:MAG: N-acetylmuramoyl-L-alanine amidase [Thomasclavelia sp.]|jgi:uncharacterized protein YjdB|nr:N-acetylmuramoyl-L-alanine amidase [Thomasclavelia sp.]